MFFDARVEHTVFCDVFVTGRLKCIVNTSVFFTFITSSSQSKPSKNTGICSVLTRQNAKKNTMFGGNFSRFFGPCPPASQKSKIFYPIFWPPLIQTQEGVKSQKIARLHLNSTFFLSQSLPQSSKSKNCPSLSGPQNAVNYGVLWPYHAFYRIISGPPPPLAKATCC